MYAASLPFSLLFFLCRLQAGLRDKNGGIHTTTNAFVCVSGTFCGRDVAAVVSASKTLMSATCLSLVLYGQYTHSTQRDI